MAIFKMHCVKACSGEKKIFYYNNITNEFFDSNMDPLTWDEKLKKDSSERILEDFCAIDSGNTTNGACLTHYKQIHKVKKFRIKLGFDCNYRCSYCIQEHDGLAQEAFLPIEDFLAFFPEDINPDVFEFWGGEPFLYWDTLKPLVEALRNRFPESHFYMATNGSLLDYEKNEWLEKINCGMSISHDGPGQHIRGIDPLQNPEQRAIIFDLLKKRPQRISFNPILNSKNQSRKQIDEWFQRELKELEFSLGEGGFFTPCQPEHKEYCLANRAEHVKYRRNSLYEIREGLFPHMSIGDRRFGPLFRAFINKVPSTSMISSCENTKEHVMCLDLAGNVLSCQNCSTGDIAPNGNSQLLGNLKDPDNIFFNTAVSWQDRPECRVCPVLSMCGGGCLVTPDETRSLACDAWFSDYIPFMVSVIEVLTRYLPYYFEGPQEEDRRDVFGVIENGEEELIEVDTQHNREIIQKFLLRSMGNKAE